MSIENLKKFAELCGKDEKIREKADGFQISDKDGLIAYAAEEHGLPFTSDDLVALANEILSSRDQLSDDDLEKVAGGGLFSCYSGMAIGSIIGAAAGIAGVSAGIGMAGCVIGTVSAASIAGGGYVGGAHGVVAGALCYGSFLGGVSAIMSPI